MKSRIARCPEAPRPASRLGPARGFTIPAAPEGGTPVNPLEAEDRARRFGHSLASLASPAGPPIQAMLKSPAVTGGSGGMGPGKNNDKDEDEDDFIASNDEDEVEDEDEDEDVEEEDDEYVYNEEDEANDSEEERWEKKQKQNEKQRNRQEKLKANKEKGSKIDKSSLTYKLGTASRATSQIATNLLEQSKTLAKQIQNTTKTVESTSHGPLGLTSVSPFVALTAYNNASKVPSNVTTLETEKGKISRGGEKKRKAAEDPGRKRTSTLEVPGIGSYDKISKHKTKKAKVDTNNNNNNDEESRAEKLLRSVENRRDPSTAASSHIKKKLWQNKKITKKQAKGDQEDYAAMELIGATIRDPNIENLKTQNIGNTLSLLNTANNNNNNNNNNTNNNNNNNNDFTLTTSTGGTPLLASQHFQTLHGLIQRPLSPSHPSRLTSAITDDFRMIRESEDLSGILTPTPEEIEKHHGSYKDWKPHTDDTGNDSEDLDEDEDGGEKEKEGKKEKKG